MSSRLYYTDDCVFMLPSGFRDQTTQLVEWTGEDGSPIVLAVQRDPLPRPLSPAEPSFDLDAYVAAQVKSYPAQFPGYRLEKDEASRPNGVEIRRKGFRWTRGADVVYHAQVFALAPPVVLLFSAGGKAINRARVDALVDGIFENLQFRVD